MPKSLFLTLLVSLKASPSRDSQKPAIARFFYLKKLKLLNYFICRCLREITPNSSEKLSPNQIRLFDEAELDAERETEEDLTANEAVDIPAHTRQKCGRKPLPALLPRIDVVHELTEAEHVCPHDGRPLKVIGEVTSEQLDIVPAKIQVLRHVRKQYACDCGQCIRNTTQPAHSQT